MGRWKELAEAYEEPTPAARARAVALLFEEAHARAVSSTPISPRMTDREMLHILQARLLYNPHKWYPQIKAAGGPSKGRLDGYISGVLAGYAMRVDQRIRPILLALENGVEPAFKVPPLPLGPFKYHPGKPPPHKRRRAARQAKIAAAAKAVPGASS